MGTTAKDSIPLHRLGEQTDEGFQVDRISGSNGEVDEAIMLGTHRDDHYIFLLQEKGLSKVMIDFSFFIQKGMSALFILPGQVHRYLESDKATEGWFLAVDAGLIPDAFRAVLEDSSRVKQPVSLSADDLEPLANCLQLIYTISAKESASPIYKQASYGLLSSFAALLAGLCLGRPGSMGGQPSRPMLITREFRKLLLLQFKVCKSPAEYASSSHHQPAPGKRLVFLGDETTIGHFFALHQLAGKHARVEGAIVLAHKHHQHEFSDYFSYLGLQTLDKEGAGRYGELEKWADELKTDGQDTVFYLAGYSPAVGRLRKLLKGKGFAGSQIRCQGFWD